MSYQPLSHSSHEFDKQWSYSSSRPMRFVAEVILVIFCGAPLFFFIAAAIRISHLIISAVHSLIATAIIAAIVCTTVVKILLSISVRPTRPASAHGCLDDNEVAEKRRVAVIGAGISGLMTAKELLAEGHSVVVFESGNDIGGAWVVNTAPGRGRVWLSTVSTSSSLNTGISDFPLPSYFPNTTDPFHVTQSVFKDYIDKYAAHFGVTPLVRFRTHVTDVSKHGDKWRIASRSSILKNEVVDDFDAVAVCTGQVQNPRIPEFGDEMEFKGRIVHIASVKNAEEFSGKNVVCVGTGETSADITEIVANRASSCSLSVRSPFICLSRNWFGVPPDFFETRALYTCPFWVRWLVLKPQLFAVFALQYWNRSCGKRVSQAPSWHRIQKLLFTPQYLRDIVTGRRSPCDSVLLTKADGFLHAIDNGTCLLKPSIQSLEENKVLFRDGTKVNCDTLLLFTGYKEKFYMFRGKNLEQLNSSCGRKRYLTTFDPTVGSSLAFIGFCRSHAGSLIIPSEMQARWFALLVSGKRKLPSQEAMEKNVAAASFGSTGYHISLGGWFLANFIARHGVGCEPNAFRLIWNHGPVVAWRVYTQSFAGPMFRFEGSHAKPKMAQEFYTMVASCGKPSMWYFIEITTMALGTIFDCINSIPFLAKYRVLNSLMDIWW